MSSEPIDDDAVARAYLDSTRRLLAAVDVDQVTRVVKVLREARERAATVYIVGNGGSAATASHFAADLSKATVRDGSARVRALSLTDNVALMTALSNDQGYEQVFTGQLHGLLRADDVLIAISASGNSPSVLRAVELAHQRRATSIAFVGFDGGELLRCADLAIHVASERGVYGPVEDLHLAIHHLVTTCLARG